jgi:hypothetical protein
MALSGAGANSRHLGDRLISARLSLLCWRQPPASAAPCHPVAGGCDRGRAGVAASPSTGIRSDMSRVPLADRRSFDHRGDHRKTSVTPSVPVEREAAHLEACGGWRHNPRSPSGWSRGVPHLAPRRQRRSRSSSRSNRPPSTGGHASRSTGASHPPGEASAFQDRGFERPTSGRVAGRTRPALPLSQARTQTTSTGVIRRLAPCRRLAPDIQEPEASSRSSPGAGGPGRRPTQPAAAPRCAPARRRPPVGGAPPYACDAAFAPPSACRLPRYPRNFDRDRTSGTTARTPNPSRTAPTPARPRKPAGAARAARTSARRDAGAILLGGGFHSAPRTSSGQRFHLQTRARLGWITVVVLRRRRPPRSCATLSSHDAENHAAFNAGKYSSFPARTPGSFSQGASGRGRRQRRQRLPPLPDPISDSGRILASRTLVFVRDPATGG